MGPRLGMSRSVGLWVCAIVSTPLQVLSHQAPELGVVFRAPEGLLAAHDVSAGGQGVGEG